MRIELRPPIRVWMALELLDSGTWIGTVDRAVLLGAAPAASAKMPRINFSSHEEKA